MPLQRTFTSKISKRDWVQAFLLRIRSIFDEKLANQLMLNKTVGCKYPAGSLKLWRHLGGIY